MLCLFFFLASCRINSKTSKVDSCLPGGSYKDFCVSGDTLVTRGTRRDRPRSILVHIGDLERITY